MLQFSLIMDTLMLISASPRRQEMLKNAGISYRSAPSHIDEAMTNDEHPADVVQRLALAKLEAFLSKDMILGCKWALAADTVVHYMGCNIGKPLSRDEAEQTLKQLNGQTHQVYTGMTLFSRHTGKRYTCFDVTNVTFQVFSNEDLQWYLDSGEWQDAAGAYKIQGRGQSLIQSIQGSLSNVMGLPMHKLYRLLRDLNYQFS
jgi:septum formation protein